MAPLESNFQRYLIWNKTKLLQNFIKRLHNNTNLKVFQNRDAKKFNSVGIREEDRKKWKVTLRAWKVNVGLFFFFNPNGVSPFILY